MNGNTHVFIVAISFLCTLFVVCTNKIGGRFATKTPYLTLLTTFNEDHGSATPLSYGMDSKMFEPHRRSRLT